MNEISLGDSKRYLFCANFIAPFNLKNETPHDDLINIIFVFILNCLHCLFSTNFKDWYSSFVQLKAIETEDQYIIKSETVWMNPIEPDA